MFTQTQRSRGAGATNQWKPNLSQQDHVFTESLTDMVE